MKTTNKKNLRKLADRLNGIIYSQNLYGIDGKRYINARVVNGKLVVENLWTGEAVEVFGKRFVNGYGSEVILEENKLGKVLTIHSLQH